jgi:hypothetical protein
LFFFLLNSDGRRPIRVNTKSKSTVALLLASLTLGGAVSAAPAAHHYLPPPDSYLRYSVYSVSQLIKEVQQYPSVRQRYAQQFQIPESQVASYMRHNLVESWVPQTGMYTVYCVNHAGKIFTVKQKFHKGTKVFALRNGEPVMKWICGNPLMRYHADLAMAPIVRQKLSPSIQALTPADTTAALLVPGEIAAAPTLVSIPATEGASSIFPGAAKALFALPLLGFLSNSGHGGGGGGTPPLIPHRTPDVPEPASPILLLAALPFAALVIARRRAGTSRP